MANKVRFSTSAIIVSALAVPLASPAQTTPDLQRKLMDIGNGLVLEINPAGYETYTDNSNCERLGHGSVEWIEIPATYETIIETVTIQDGYKDVEVSPPRYDIDGVLKTPAKAELVDVPAITKTRKRRVVKTPARRVKRTIPLMCDPDIKRRVVTPKSFTVKDWTGAGVEHFETAEAFANYMKAK